MPNLGVWDIVAILLLVLLILLAGRLAGLRTSMARRRRQAPAAVVTLPATEVVAEITCPSCNAVNMTGQTFCGQCGNRLTPPAA